MSTPFQASKLPGATGTHRWVSFVSIATLLFSVGYGDRGAAQTMSVEPPATTVARYSVVEGGPFDVLGSTTWTLGVALPGTGGETTLDFTASSNRAWLAVDPGNGTLGGAQPPSRAVSASLVEAEAENLPPGTYTATVTLENVTTGLGYAQRSVELQIVPASFSVAPSFVNVIAALNDASTIPPFVVTLTNASVLPLSFRVSGTSRSWYSLSTTTGTVPPSGAATFTILVNAAGLIPGKYIADLEVRNTTNGVGTTTIPLTLLVRAAGAGAVTLSPDADVVAEGPEGHVTLPGVQVNKLENGSDRFVLWSAVSDASWVSVSPLGGELAPAGEASGLDEAGVQIRMNAAVNTLPAGSHVATVTFNNLSTGVPIATRVLRVVAHPTLRVEDGNVIGGSVAVRPLPMQRLNSGEMVFDLGQLVVLTAEAQDGYTFETWWLDEEGGDVDDEDENPVVVVMNRSRVVRASIVPIGRTLTLSSSGLGTGTVTASPTGTSADNELISRYENGTNVVLLATADAGSVFVGWAGNVAAGSEKISPLTVTMDRDRVITAQFEAEVSLAVNVIGEGSVTVDPAQETYAFGDELTLRAQPAEDWLFQSWSGDVDGSTATLLVTLSGPTSVLATFVPDDNGPPDDLVTLTVEVEGDGAVSPEGGEFDRNARVTLVATPDVGWAFARWEGAAQGTQPATEIVLDDDLAVRAVFEADETADRPATDPTVPSPCGALGMLGLGLCGLGLATMRRRVAALRR